jgi:hypothetical protein
MQVSGRRPAAGTVGAHRRLSTDGHGRGALAGVFRLEVTAEPGVHPGAAARRSARLPGMDKGRPRRDR